MWKNQTIQQGTIMHAMSAPRCKCQMDATAIYHYNGKTFTLITFIGFKLFTTLKRLFLILNQKLNQSHLSVTKLKKNNIKMLYLEDYLESK